MIEWCHSRLVQGTSGNTGSADKAPDFVDDDYNHLLGKRLALSCPHTLTGLASESGTYCTYGHRQPVATLKLAGKWFRFIIDDDGLLFPRT